MVTVVESTDALGLPLENDSHGRRIRRELLDEGGYAIVDGSHFGSLPEGQPGLPASLRSRLLFPAGSGSEL